MFFLIFILIQLGQNFCNGQLDFWKTHDFCHVIHQNGTHIQIDLYGNLYLIGETSIQKFSKSNETENFILDKSLQLNRLGRITQMDVSNPQKILIFFNDFQSLIFFDNDLNELYQIDLSQLSDIECELICNSSENGLWVWRGDQKQLIFLNSNLNIERRSLKFPANLENAKAIYMLEKNNRIYVLFDNQQLFIFDLFANYIEQLEVLDIQKFSFFENDLAYFSKKNIILQKLDHATILPLDENLQDAIDAQVINDQIYIQYCDSIRICPFRKN